MSDKQYMTLSNTQTLDFKEKEDGASRQALLDISNPQTESNIAYKIKTTAPKLFVVKPIQGIIAPGRTVSVEIHIQESQVKSEDMITKNKF